MIAEQKELLSDMGREDNCSRTVTADKSLEISRGGCFPNGGNYLYGIFPICGSRVKFHISTQRLCETDRVWNTL